jgi:hypothetical protein
MPGAFHSQTEKQLQERINQINREIDSLIKFRIKCENRIQHLCNRAIVPTNKEFV